MEKAVIAHAAESLGQDMLQEEPQQVLAFERTILRGAGAAVGVWEGHGSVAMGH
jgi:hypothetical protein